MKEFKAGDQVKRIAFAHEGMKVGDVAVVKSIADKWNLYLDGYEYAHDPANFELVQDEKENISNFLREQKWFIRTGSPEKSKLVQEWLFEHGCEWLCGKGKLSDFNEKYLTNTSDTGKLSKYIMHGNGYKDITQEITLEFETIVKSVKLPETPKPTEQELRIIELEAAISKAQEQVKKIKEEM